MIPAFTRYRSGGGGGGDPHFSAVSLLLHCDGSNGSTSFPDSSSYAKTVNATGGAHVTTSNPKFGTGSAIFSSTTDYLGLASDATLQFGTGDFTIEQFVRMTSAPGSFSIVIDFRPSGAEGIVPTIYIGSDQQVRFFVNGGDRITGASALALNTWSHVAVCRASGTTTLYIDGVATGSPYTDSNNYTANPIRIAQASRDGAGQFYGQIDELRITKGFARYTANFTPPSAPFPNHS
jgi:hypothetical protein